MNTVEFRDPDGTYILAAPFDDARCRVLASNVLARGQVVCKDPELSWEEAAEDVGGFTRLAPDDLSPDESEDPETRSLLREIEDGDASFSRTSDDGLDPMTRVPDPASLGRLTEDDDSPHEILERLLVHYLRAHSGRSARDLARSGCGCPGFRLGGARTESRIHALVGLALAAKRFSDLERLVDAYRERKLAGARAA